MTMPTASLTERQEHMITPKELQEARNTLYRGKPVTLLDYHKVFGDKPKCVIQDKVKDWYEHVIVFESGCTYTMVEYATYLRNVSVPLGKHPMSCNFREISHKTGPILNKRRKKK